nr:hypothetical protein [Candidatus Gracilibacteria bacterium]
MLKKANAATKTALAMITGNYNGKFLKVSTGGLDYILAIPSIINGDIQDVDLMSLINKKQLVYNLPDSYKNLGYTMTGGFDFIPGRDIVIFSGSMLDLSSSGFIQQQFITNLQTVYSGSILSNDSEIKQIT